MQKHTIEGGGEFTVEVIDSVQDYLQLMKQIFDFKSLKALITGAVEGQKINMLVNALSGGAIFIGFCCLCCFF